MVTGTRHSARGTAHEAAAAPVPQVHHGHRTETPDDSLLAACYYCRCTTATRRRWSATSSTSSCLTLTTTPRWSPTCRCFCPRTPFRCFYPSLVASMCFYPSLFGSTPSRGLTPSSLQESVDKSREEMKGMVEASKEEGRSYRERALSKAQKRAPGLFRLPLQRGVERWRNSV